MAILFLADRLEIIKIVLGFKKRVYVTELAKYRYNKTVVKGWRGGPRALGPDKRCN